MKILYDHTVFQFQKYGGISRYFYELITRVSSRDSIEVNFFQGLHINEYALSQHKQKFESYFGYRWRYKYPTPRFFPHIFAMPNNVLFERMWLKNGNYDIYHPTYYMKGLKSIGKRRIVITVYDMIHELYPDKFKDSKSVIKNKKEAIDIADAIVAISHNTKKDLMNIYNVADEKIYVIHLANSMKMSSSSTIIQEEISETNTLNKPYILYVGDRSSYKNFDILLESYKDSLSESYNLICFGGQKFNHDFLKEINGKYDGKIMHLTGSDKTLEELYKNAHCFVYPSLYEGFGIPPLESMAMGCPVVASNTSSIPEVVGNAAVLFDPHSKEELVSAIESLKNENKRRKLIKCGFEREKDFSWDKVASETIQVYDAISRTKQEPL